jgi:uncharacterized cupredoxin-like copper-binding protein
MVAISLIVAVCSSQAPPEPLEMTINMAEYAFAPPDLGFQVGQEVTLHLTNSGALEHEIMFGHTVMMTDGMPNGYMVDMFESAGIEPVVTVEKSEDGEHEEGEHMDGDEHDKGDHMDEEEHAHSGLMVRVLGTMIFMR